MRVLFDENPNRRLKRFFSEEFEVITTAEHGWNGKSNGELLELAGKEFDVLLTTDKGIPNQQNLARFDLAVVLLRAKRATPTRNSRSSWTKPSPHSPLPLPGP